MAAVPVRRRARTRARRCAREKLGSPARRARGSAESARTGARREDHFRGPGSASDSRRATGELGRTAAEIRRELPALFIVSQVEVWRTLGRRSATSSARRIADSRRARARQEMRALLELFHARGRERRLPDALRALRRRACRNRARRRRSAGSSEVLMTAASRSALASRWLALAGRARRGPG